MPHLCVKLLFNLLITYTYPEGKLTIWTAFLPDALCPPSMFTYDSWPCSHLQPFGDHLLASQSHFRKFASTKTMLTPRALAQPAESLFNLIMRSHLDYIPKNRSRESIGRKTCQIVSSSNSFCLENVPSLWKTHFLRLFCSLPTKWSLRHNATKQKQGNNLSSPSHS